MEQDLLKEDFTIISNKVIEDKNLSLKAKGLFIVLARLPKTWEYSEQGILTIINGNNKKNNDGIKSLKTAIHELEEYHYLIRIQNRDKNGKFNKIKWILTDKF